MKSSSSSLLIVSALWLALVLGCEPSTNRRYKTTLETGGPIPLSSAYLVAAYKENEVAADERYKGQVLAVTGTVDSIGKDILDTMYVTLSSDEEYGMTTVQCFFADASRSQLASLRKGQRVTIAGVCDGKLGNVMLKDSELRETPP